MAAGFRYVVLACLAVPRVAAAQSAQDKAEAEVLFNAGRDALTAGNFAEACPKLAGSEKRDPAIGTSLYLAECYERSGKIASAWAEFRQAEDMARQRNDNRASIAKARAERLVPSKLVIVLADGAGVPGLEVKRDGSNVARVELGLGSPVDGGTHVVVVTAPGRSRFEWQGNVPTSGGIVTVTVPTLAEESAKGSWVQKPVAPAVSSGANPVRVAGFVLGSAGLASLVAGSIFGGLAIARNNDANANCPANGGMGCFPAGVSAGQDASTFATISTATFIAAGALVVAGIAFVVVGKPKHTSIALGPSAVLLHGSF